MRLCLFAIFAFLAACSGDAIDKENGPVVIVNNDPADMRSSNPDIGGGEDTGGSIDLGGPTTEPDGPVILEFSASPSRMTEGGTVNITVNLTDPQGFDDIGGGRVLDRNDEVLGAFSGSGGTYSFALTWQAVHALDPISFDSGEQRAFVAEFFDAANHRARQPFAIDLHCDGGPACNGTCGLEQCDGVCRDLASFEDDPANCGTCGRTCPGDICIDGECTDCRPIEQSIGPCDPLCQTGCGATEACIFGGDPTAPQSVCAPTGGRQPGQQCTMDDLCVAGAVCGAVDPENPMDARCFRICRLGGGEPGCMGANVCRQASAHPELGICAPPQ